MLLPSILLQCSLAGVDWTAPRPENPQNVLLIISDDLRAEIDAVGFGCATVNCSTPCLRQLSEDAGSVSFTRAYVQQALCAPTRNSFMTGRRPDATKSWNFRDSFREKGVGADWITLPEFFRIQSEPRYTVVGTGKVFHKGLPPNWDLNHSWDPRMSDGTWEKWMYPSEPRCPGNTSWCAVANESAVYDDTHITQVALQLLRNITKLDAPWFLAVGYRKPHVQWRFPERFLNHIPAESVMPAKYPLFPANAPPVAFHMPVNDFLEPFQDVADCGGVDTMRPTQSFPVHCQLEWRRAYHASVAFMDDQVGVLREELAALKVADNTVIAFFGDHGWHLGELAEWEKFTNFELAARVPLIINAPWLAAAAAAEAAVQATRNNAGYDGSASSMSSADAVAAAERAAIAKNLSALLTAGRATRSFAELVDVYPTLVQLALPAGRNNTARNVEGVSLVPAMIASSPHTGVAFGAKTQALTQFPRCCLNASLPEWKFNDCDDVDRSNFTHMGLSIRTDRWRFTKWYTWVGRTLKPNWTNPIGDELYDHDGDDGLDLNSGHEAHSVATANPAIVDAMTLRLEAAFGRKD